MVGPKVPIIGVSVSKPRPCTCNVEFCLPACLPACSVYPRCTAPLHGTSCAIVCTLDVTVNKVRCQCEQDQRRSRRAAETAEAREMRRQHE